MNLPPAEIERLWKFLTPDEKAEITRYSQRIEKSQNGWKPTLVEFIREGWHVLEPATPYIHGWHIDAIAEHLTAVTNGQIQELLINMPPRHAKSLIVSVFWPCWEWTQTPEKRFLFASYGQNLSTRDSRKCRMLIQSPWFQKNFGHIFKLTHDQNQKTRFDNDKSGSRIATSVGGLGTGEGGDRIVCLPYDSRIATDQGQLKIGDIVENKLDVNVLGPSGKWQKILKYEVNPGREAVKLTSHGDELICTNDHLVWIDKIGYIQAKIIKPSFLVRKLNGNLSPVESIESSDYLDVTYNIQVENDHAYFANGILVHNCDDPHNVEEAESNAIRESTLIWWDETMSTRLNNPKTGAKLIVMQRVHDKDLSGHVLEQGGYVHLCLPAEYEEPTAERPKVITSIGWTDPRSEDGQLLWPERFDRVSLDKLKRSLGPYGAAGQLQQRPSPREGGLIKLAWFKYYSQLPSPVAYILQSWDTAFKTASINDFSVCTTWAVINGGFYLLNRYKAKMEYPSLKRQMIALYNQYRPNTILIEDKASGQSLIQEMSKPLKDENDPKIVYKLPIRAFKAEIDKVARVNACSTTLETNVFLPQNADWKQDYLDNLSSFPNAAHDDDVDSTTQALIYLALQRTGRPAQSAYVPHIGR